MNNILQYLETIHPISAGLQEYLSKTLKYKKFYKKDFLLKAGHVSRSVYFITEGLIRAYYNKGDKEVNSWFMKEGDVSLSIESFYDQKPSYENIQALEDSTVYFIDYKELQYIYSEYSEFNYIGRVLTEKYHILWSQQLYSIRMQSAPERYEWLLRNHPDLLLRVPAKFIASYLDITEVTLSRLKAKRLVPNSF